VTIELDHVFICSDIGAPEARQLIEFGLVEGSPNRHPGQGTANRRFFFENAFLELLWVEDEIEAQSDLVRRTGLRERWHRRKFGASPFGIGFRPALAGACDLPFPTWEYRPPYLPDPLAIHMADDSATISSPLLFHLPFGRRPNRDDPARRQPREHPAGVRQITSIQIVVSPNVPIRSHHRATESQCDRLCFASGPEHLMVVEFDARQKDETSDFRPILPLIIHR
jgi:hypothetical protein